MSFILCRHVPSKREIYAVFAFNLENFTLGRIFFSRPLAVVPVTNISHSHPYISQTFLSDWSLINIKCWWANCVFYKPINLYLVAVQCEEMVFIWDLSMGCIRGDQLIVEYNLCRIQKFDILFSENSFLYNIWRHSILEHISE